MIEIRYRIRPFIKPNGQVAVRVRWNNNESEVTFITGKYAEKGDKWNDDSHKAKMNTTHRVRNNSCTASEINSSISDFIEAIEDTFNQYALENKIPTTVELKEIVNGILRPKEISILPSAKSVVKKVKRRSMADFHEEFVRTMAAEKNWNEKCREKYVQALHHLQYANPKITPYNITKDAMQRLKDWYISNQFKNSTIKHQVWLVKCFFKWLNQQEGVVIPEDVLSYSTHLDMMPRTVTFLNYNELVYFASFEFKEPNGYKSHARDLWCFMAFTSLRYSDLNNLKKAHIVDGRIEMITQKTSERITIPLVDGALAILAKYRNYEDDEGHVFPVPSNQKLNGHIKEAAEEAGLDRLVIYTYLVGKKREETQKKFYEVISCHDGRRTFVSNSLAMGIPPQVVMKATGHRNYNTMKPYIDTAVETQTIEMEKWNRNRYKSGIITALERLDVESLKNVLELAQSLVR